LTPLKTLFAALKRPPTIDATRRSLTRYFFTFIGPAIIVALSLVMLFLVKGHYAQVAGPNLSFKHYTTNDASSSPEYVLSRLAEQPEQSSALSNTYSWLLLDVPENAKNNKGALHLPSGAAQALICWNSQTMAVLGQATRQHSSGDVLASKRGFSLLLRATPFPTSVLCRASFLNSAPLFVEHWSVSDLQQSAIRFNRSMGFLEGGLMTIAGFLLLNALLQRDRVYFLLGLWLIGNLRLSAYAMGWDGLWLGQVIAPHWITHIRPITIAVYYLLTYALFIELFRQEAVIKQHRRLLKASRTAIIAVLIGVFVLPSGILTPLLWIVGVCGAIILTYLFGLLFKNARRDQWRWMYLTTILVIAGLTLFVFLGNTHVPQSMDAFHSVASLLFSNVFIALAVVKRVRRYHKDRANKQTELALSHASGPIGMFSLSSNGSFAQSNSALNIMLGLDAKKPSAANWSYYFPTQNWEEVAQYTEAGGEVEIIPEQHSPLSPSSRYALRALFEDGKISGSLQDISARKQSSTETLDINDPLTDFLNHAGVHKELTEALAQRRTGKPCALAYLNLQQFKRINKLFGHAVGDDVLKKVGKRIRKDLPHSAKVGRVGGDKFVIIYPGSTANSALESANKIVDHLNGSPLAVGSRAFPVNAAIGLIDITSAMTGQRAIAVANAACEDARQQSCPVVIYGDTSAKLSQQVEALRIFHQLEAKETPPGLALAMQPILSLVEPEHSLNFEVLLRASDLSGVLLPTYQIIAAAENNHAITAIDQWVFSTTLKWLSENESRLSKTKFINVNLSGTSLNDKKFIEGFYETLDRYSHITNRLCVEITETVALQNVNHSREFIQRVRKQGVRIALDDFGAGYSSFSNLKELPIDVIKIDGRLIKDMCRSSTDMAIVRTVVQLTRNLGAISIAEWVEDTATIEALQKMGVDYVQGYTVSAARSPETILAATSVTDLIDDPATLALVTKKPARRPGG
jgi:diguanylate cyclase (GGDEF)-like protein